MGKFPRKAKASQCQICDEIFEEGMENEALNCCLEEKVHYDKEFWQCIECDELHEEKEEAYSCCD